MITQSHHFSRIEFSTCGDTVANLCARAVYIIANRINLSELSAIETELGSISDHYCTVLVGFSDVYCECFVVNNTVFNNELPLINHFTVHSFLAFRHPHELTLLVLKVLSQMKLDCLEYAHA